MFKPSSRHAASFVDVIEGTNYRFEGPLRTGIRGRSRRRPHPLLRALVLLAIIWFIARLIRGRRGSGWF